MMKQLSSRKIGKEQNSNKKGPGQDISPKNIPSVSYFLQLWSTTVLRHFSDLIKKIESLNRLSHSLWQSPHNLIISKKFSADLTDMPKVMLFFSRYYQLEKNQD